MIDDVEKNVTYGICSHEHSPGALHVESGEFKKYGINPTKITGWQCNKGVMGQIIDRTGYQLVESLMPGSSTTYDPGFAVSPLARTIKIYRFDTTVTPMINLYQGKGCKSHAKAFYVP